MNFLFKRKFLTSFAGILLSGVCLAQTKPSVNPAPFVIPAFREWKGETGIYKLKKRTVLVIDSVGSEGIVPYVKTFINDLKVLHPENEFIIKHGKPSKGDICFTINKGDTTIKAEGYLLRITDFITIEASDSKGAFWATRSILQILEQSPDHNVIPKGFAKDYPQFAIRGFVLDVGRKFFSIGFLRDYVKFMSYYKMNDFQIHLNDNGFKQFFNNDWDKTYSAFRLESKTYPNLTARDGSYSKKEFIELQKLAEEYGVTIIPEIDVPAHALAFTKAIPAIGSAKYGLDHLDISNPFTYEVVDNVFKEYLEGVNPVFRGKEVHIGTDEYAKDESEKFRSFTDHYIKYVEGFGKRARLWGALTHAAGTTPVKVKDVTMNVWYNGYADPKEMIKQGYDVISTPDGWLYIVPKAGYYYDYLNIKNIYDKWTPNVIGNQTFEVNHPQIKGGSFAVWNDHVGNGITEKDVHDRVFPAMQVLAQKMWTGTDANRLITFDMFSKQSHKIGEAPGLNIAGKINGKDSLILYYDFNKMSIRDKSADKRNPAKTNNSVNKFYQGKKGIYFSGVNSYIQTPIKEIGYDYTISFFVNPEAGNMENAILFTSRDATVKLKQQNTGKLGFSRENYNYNFNYSVPENKWTHIVITGDNKGTSLYVDGILFEKLEGEMQIFPNTKGKIAKVQTLFFPLEKIGNDKNGFKGYMDDLKIFNKVLLPEQIEKLAK